MAAQPILSGHIETNYNGIPGMRRELRSKIAELINKACFDIEAKAKEWVPVKTGTLRNSIRVMKTATEGDLVGEVGVFRDYGIYVEMGTVRMAARPYLGRAFSLVSSSFKAAVQQAITSFGRPGP